MHHDRETLDSILRNDFLSFLRLCFKTVDPGVPFEENWHHAAIWFELDRIRRGELTRSIINLPPRYLKSLIVSVSYVAFILGHDPRRRIFVISYGDDLADKHAAAFRSIVESDWYKRLFPKMRVKRIHDNEVTTTARGFRKATTVMGPLTGLGGDLFIIDDPQKTQDAMSETKRNALNHWVPNTLMSRLDNKRTGAIIVVAQRTHVQDLSGFLLDSSPDWHLLSLPAIAQSDEKIQVGQNTFHYRERGEALHPAREPLETLEQLRRDIGPDIFAAQYLQSPVPEGGNMIRREWLVYYTDLPRRTSRTRILISLDTAAKVGPHNSWSVFTVWQVESRQDWYLLHVVRGRFEYPQLRDTALSLAERYKPHVTLIEDTSVGMALVQELKQKRRGRIQAVPVEKDKESRLYVHQAKFAAGRVHFPFGASFLPEVEMELLRFPQGKTDDIVDSISQALAWKPGYDTTLSWID